MREISHSMRILGSNVAIPQVRKNPLHPAGAECLHVRMTDMLVRLYDLPEDAASITPVGEGIQIRRARAYERHHAANFARSFSEKWASEVEVAMSRQPVSCFIATLDQTIVGFACYDTTMRGFFGPTGVAESARGRGIGKCLLMHSLIALREAGYAYAVIGGVGPREFYEKVCGAVVIPGSDPGIYRDLLPS